MVRLLAFKTILILGYVNQIDPTGFFLGSFIIISVIIASEIILNTYGGKSFRLWLSKALITFGSPKSENQESYVTSISSVPKDQTPLPKTGAIVSQTQEPIQQEKIEAAPKKEEKIEIKQEKKPSAISRVLGGTGILVKAFIMTILMLIVSFFEVILSFLVFATSFDTRGIYEVPVLKFSGYFSIFRYSYSPFILGGYVFTMWYTLILLSIQIFFIVSFQWYILATNKPEGIILKLYRNLTRILLGVVIIGLLIQMTLEVVYIPLQILIVIALIFFSEITAWKVRSEKEKIVPQSQQEFPVPDNEGVKSDLVKSPKTS